MLLRKQSKENVLLSFIDPCTLLDPLLNCREKISQPQEAVMVSRALPPTPCKISDAEVVEQIHLHCEDLSEDTSTETCPVEPKDIAASIEKVKDVSSNKNVLKCHCFLL